MGPDSCLKPTRREHRRSWVRFFSGWTTGPRQLSSDAKGHCRAAWSCDGVSVDFVFSALIVKGVFR